MTLGFIGVFLALQGEDLGNLGLIGFADRCLEFRLEAARNQLLELKSVSFRDSGTIAGGTQLLKVAVQQTIL